MPKPAKTAKTAKLSQLIKLYLDDSESLCNRAGELEGLGVTLTQARRVLEDLLLYVKNR